MSSVISQVVPLPFILWSHEGGGAGVIPANPNTNGESQKGTRPEIFISPTSVVRKLSKTIVFPVSPNFTLDKHVSN